MKLRLPIDTIRKIKFLRRRGYSIPEISKECRISRSTALRYTKNIKIIPKYLKRWEERRNASKIISERKWAIAKKNAEQLIKSLGRKNLILIGTMLYWAEGAKKDFSFSNTDPKMIRVFLFILRKFFDIKNDNMKISIRIFKDLNKKRCSNFWSKLVGFPKEKITFNILEGSKKGKLKYGMCRIRIKKGGLLLKKFSAIIDKIDQLIF